VNPLVGKEERFVHGKKNWGKKNFFFEKNKKKKKKRRATTPKIMIYESFCTSPKFMKFLLAVVLVVVFRTSTHKSRSVYSLFPSKICVQT
jgi:hypothetical protein